MGALGSLSLRAVLPKLPKATATLRPLFLPRLVDILVVIELLNRRQDNDLVLVAVQVDLYADIIT